MFQYFRNFNSLISKFALKSKESIFYGFFVYFSVFWTHVLETQQKPDYFCEMLLHPCLVAQ